MARKTRDVGSIGTERQEDKGLSMGDILMLPDSQRRVVQWMMRQGDCALHDVAANTEQDEGDAAIALYDLMEQGFVQEIEVDGETLYRIRLASKEGIKQLPQTIQQALAPGKPLAVIPNPSGDYAVIAGSTFELCVTVSNKGNQSALIDIYIDEVSQMLRQWCDSPFERLALSPKSTSEVVFQFQVPAQTLPGTFHYQLVVDAPQHYPEDTPIRYSQRLQVLSAIEDAVTVSDPTFTVIPATSSVAPLVVQPGQPLQVTVLVDNRSDRVDRFWLSCSDLQESWFTVRYPEGLQLPGLVTATDGLDLNPGAKGEIVLLLHPPLNALAGNYFATLRLQSANHLDAVLLDVIYLQVLPVYLITVELRTLLGQVKRSAGLFEVRLTNAGNTERDIIVRTISFDEDNLCTYTLEPVEVRILPGSVGIVALEVEPNQWWRRPIYGGGRLIHFGVELEDPKLLPVPNDLPQGALLWEPRPWWQFLLVLLAGVGTLAAIAFLIWWLFFRPPAPPKIVEFSSDNPSYQEAEGDFVQLNWQIRNPRQIQAIALTGQSPDGSASVQPVTYDFSKGVPNQLKEFCIIRTMLICKHVRTEARQPGNYVFELKVFSKRKKDAAADFVKTNTVKIQSVAPPKISEFFSTKPVYQEASISSRGGVSTPAQKPAVNSPSGDMILLNWKINNPEQLKELRLIARLPDGSAISGLRPFNFTQGIPKELQEFCQLPQELICKNLPTGIRKPGDYVFELTAIPKKGEGEKPISAKTDTIKILPNIVPIKIVAFKVNGKDAGGKYLVPINPEKPIRPLVLTWQVEGGKDMKVEILPAPGTVPPVGAIAYPLSQQPSSETVTLKVTNGTGQEFSRSVTFETLIPPKPEPSATASSPSQKIPTRPPGLPTVPPTPLVLPLPPGLSVPSESPNAGAGSPPASPGSSPSTSPSSAPPSSPEGSPSPSPTASPSLSPGGSPSPSDPDTLSPSELPPRFD